MTNGPIDRFTYHCDIVDGWPLKYPTSRSCP